MKLRVEIQHWDTFYVIIVAVNFIVGNEFGERGPFLSCAFQYSQFYDVSKVKILS